MQELIDKIILESNSDKPTEQQKYILIWVKYMADDLLEKENLAPWRVREIWLMGFANPDHWVDITDTFHLKIAALHAHVSQTAQNKELETMLRDWGQRNAGFGGLPDGRLAEAFKIIHTD